MRRRLQDVRCQPSKRLSHTAGRSETGGQLSALRRLTLQQSKVDFLSQPVRVPRLIVTGFVQTGQQLGRERVEQVLRVNGIAGHDERHIAYRSETGGQLSALRRLTLQQSKVDFLSQPVRVPRAHVRSITSP
jgi:hypothetical protein